MKQHRAASFAAAAPSAEAEHASTEASFLDATSAATMASDTPLLDALAEEGGDVGSAVAAALTAVSAGQPVPPASTRALVAEVTATLASGRLGLLQAKLELAIGATPPEGVAADAYTRGFAALWDAAVRECTPSEHAVLATVIAGSDPLSAAASGRVTLADLQNFHWVGAHKSVDAVRRAADRFGADVWRAFVTTIPNEDLLYVDVYEATPAALRPTLLARIFADPALLAALGANAELLGRVIPDVPTSSPAFPALANAVVARDARMLPAAGLAVWAAQASPASLAALGDRARESLLAVSTPALVRGSPALPAWLDGLAAKASEVAALTLLFDLRFDLDVETMRTGGATITFDVVGLRAIWEVLQDLPAGHVTANEALRAMRRTEQDPEYASGGYSDDDGGMLYLAYPDDLARQQLGVVPNLGAQGAMKPVNAFDHTVRHEIGHSVDEGLGIMRAHGSKAAFGGWETFGNDAEAAKALVADAPGTAVTAAALTAALTDSDPWAAVAGLGAADPVSAMVAKLLGSDGGSWVGEPQTVLGPHVYRRMPDHSWQRYDQAARARKVSDYQFKTPGEWFAEVYAAYYDGDAPGGKLSAFDQATSKWMTDNVHRATVPDGG